MNRDPKSIKPSVRGQSDFYSWQLYRWVSQKPYMCQVYAGTWNSVTGIDREKPVLYIGLMVDEGWFHGKALRGLCSHGESLQSWAFGPSHDTANWKDVTEQFWTDYALRGVCAIHGDLAHFWDYPEAELRKCRWCGKEEVQQTIYHKLHVWENAA